MILIHYHLLTIGELTSQFRALDISSSEKLKSISQNIENATEDVQKFQEQSMSQLSKIDSIEKCSATSVQHSKSSRASLKRIESSLSRLEMCLSRSQHGSSIIGVGRQQSYSRLHRSGSSFLSSGRRDSKASRRSVRPNMSSNMFNLGGSSQSGESCNSFTQLSPSQLELDPCTSETWADFYGSDRGGYKPNEKSKHIEETESERENSSGRASPFTSMYSL
jgi:hypothetical protein